MPQMDIVEAAKYAGLSPTYIRYLVRHGQLKSTRETLAPGVTTTKHIIQQEDLDGFLSTNRTRSRRPDHRNKFTFYATPEELARATEVLRDAGMTAVASSIKPANFIKGFSNANSNTHNIDEEEEEAPKTRSKGKRSSS